MDSKTARTTTTELISKKNNSGKRNNNNNSNNKFFICCRPPLTPLVAINMKDAGSVRSVQSSNDGGREPGSMFVAVVDEKHGGEFPEAALSEGDADSSFDKEVMDVKRKKKGGKKKLLRVLKKAFFETSLAKKIGKKKLAQKLYQTKAKLLTEPPKSLNENSVNEESYHDENGKAVLTASSSARSPSTVTSSSMCSSTRSSSTMQSSSMCCLSVSLNSRNNVTDKNALFPGITYDKKVQKQDDDENNNVQERGKGCYGPNTGLCFLVLSLLVLVFWGKVCAIFCTSTWLFFVPRWTIGNKSENFTSDPSKIVWEDYKKKIIMEGLLERNHVSRNQ